MLNLICCYLRLWSYFCFRLGPYKWKLKSKFYFNINIIFEAYNLINQMPFNWNWKLFFIKISVKQTKKNKFVNLNGNDDKIKPFFVNLEDGLFQKTDFTKKKKIVFKFCIKDNYIWLNSTQLLQWKKCPYKSGGLSLGRQFSSILFKWIWNLPENGWSLMTGAL